MAEEVSGLVKMLRPVAGKTPGRIEIADENGEHAKEYDVTPMVWRDRLEGYRVGDYDVKLPQPTKAGPGRYTCSCHDFHYNRRSTEKGCKHTASVRVLRKNRRLK